MQYIDLSESLARLGIDFPLSKLEMANDAHCQYIAQSVVSTMPEVNEANSERALLRLVLGSRTDFMGCLALLIKLQWEQYQARDGRHAFYIDGTQALVSPEYVDQSGFVPDYDALYRLFRDEQVVLEEHGYSEQSFMLLCREMASAKLFWGDINGPELEAFRSREESNLRIFSNATEAEIQAFQRKKLLWLEVYDQLGEKILVLEQLKLRSEEISRRFMTEFGEAHLALEEQWLRLEEVGLFLDYCRSNPGASRDDIEQAVASQIAEQRKQLRQLEHAVFMAPYLEKEAGGASMSEGEFLEYRTRVKRHLLELRMLLHPDRLARHPHYEDLTSDQKQRLADLWHRVQAVNPLETGYGDDQIGGIFRSLTMLDNTLSEAKAILEQPGIDTDVQLIPRGDSLEAQMEWLAASIEWIDAQTAEVLAEVLALQQDETFRKREALLACSSQKKAEVRNEMDTLAKEYAREADELEAELESLLTGTAHDQAD